MGNTHTKSTELSDSKMMTQIINLLGEVEKFVQAIKGLISFGVFKFIVVLLLQDLNEKRKDYFLKLLLLLTIRLHHHLNHHHQLILLVFQSLLPSLGKRKFFFNFQFFSLIYFLVFLQKS
jgi:hypothetical protein